jgi:hypothetical protein
MLMCAGKLPTDTPLRRSDESANNESVLDAYMANNTSGDSANASAALDKYSDKLAELVASKMEAKLTQKLGAKKSDDENS